MTEKRFKNIGNDIWQGNEVWCVAGGEHCADVIATTLNEVLDENEQLKQVIAETEKMVQSTYDELTKLRCFKKNILRIKHSWDYLMEAIQYD